MKILAASRYGVLYCIMGKNSNSFCLHQLILWNFPLQAYNITALWKPNAPHVLLDGQCNSCDKKKFSCSIKTSKVDINPESYNGTLVCLASHGLEEIHSLMSAFNLFSSLFERSYSPASMLKWSTSYTILWALVQVPSLPKYLTPINKPDCCFTSMYFYNTNKHHITRPPSFT